MITCKMDWYYLLLWINLSGVTCNLGVDSDEYIGCFKDNPDVPAMMHEIGFSEDRTIENCVSTCKGKGYTYAGLQNAGRCYCADHYYDRYGTGTTCDFPCTGNSYQICGGYERNSVYRVNACPENCETRTSCSTSGSSCSGCKDGYRGSACQYLCASNCRNSCSQYGGECDSCKTGYHGDECKETCPTLCNNACRQSSGNCYSCKSGYWGDKCTSQCPSNCVDKCNQDSRKCNACKRGFWGNNCESSCSGCSGDCNQNDGKCSTCKVGSWGAGCEKVCSATCDDSCNKDTGKCGSCKEGYWGDTCEKNCSANCGPTCAQDTGFCTSCPIGYWADTCDISCNITCADTCNKQTGVCDNCIDKHWGHNCENDCPTNCNGTCDRQNGLCTSCQPRYYGNSCTLICPEHCNNTCVMDSGLCNSCSNGYHGENCSLRCGHCDGDACEQIDGSCPACQPGYYGDTCETACENCFEGLCNKTTGVCESGCKLGFYLEECNGTCPKNCSGCDQYNGTCSNGCNTGYFGEVCSQRCPENCQSKCTQGNGICHDGCEVGYFGRKCEQPCPKNCRENNCRQTNGSCVAGCENGFYGSFCNFSCPGCLSRCEDSGRCLDGCKAGLMGDMCDKACAAGAFGEQCVGRCHCADNVTCDAVSGDCPHGCADGYTGDACAQRMLSEPRSPGPPTGIVIGAIVGVLLVATVCVVIVVTIIRRRRKDKHAHAPHVDDTIMDNDLYHLRNGSTETPHNHLPNGTPLALETTLEMDDVRPQWEDDDPGIEEELKVAKKPVNPILASLSVKLAKTDLKQHIKKADFLQEYMSLPCDQQHPWQVASKPVNKPKSRYRGIQAYDHSRVVLELKDYDPHSDYINANYMPGYNQEKRYIAAQGPTDHTMEDMWRMVLQVGARIIVMTTNIQEANKVKCVQYWPNEGSESYGEITVTLDHEVIKQHYVIRQLTVQQGEEVRVVHHFHFSGWADHGVPDSAAPLINFRHLVRRQMGEDEEAPVIVHCSAGIGRTGTYMSLDYLLEQAEVDGWVDVPACVRSLRNARVNMIQNLAQYRFLYQALYEGITTGPTLISRETMHDTSNISAQHEVLEEEMVLSDQKKDKYYEGMTLSSKPLQSEPERNIVLHIIPTTDRTSIWELVFKKRWTTVVFICEENKDKDHADLLPEAGAPIVLPSGVRVQQCSKENMGSVWCARVSVQLPDHEYANVEERKPRVEETYYNLEGVQKDASVRVMGIRYNSPADFTPAWQQLDHGTVAILSRRLEHGAVFGVSCLLLDQINSFDEVDVFDTMRTLRKTHPGLIRDVKEYQQLHEVVKSHIALSSSNQLIHDKPASEEALYSN